MAAVATQLRPCGASITHGRRRSLSSGLGRLPDPLEVAGTARTLCASWPRVMATVIAPALRRGIFAAAFITVAVVLGEHLKEGRVLERAERTSADVYAVRKKSHDSGASDTPPCRPPLVDAVVPGVAQFSTSRGAGSSRVRRAT
jgi:hypothetical protein